MPNEPAEQMHIEYTPEFKRNLRALAKKYRHIRSDVQPVIDKLEVGEIMGVQVPRTPYTIFKMDEVVLAYRAHCPFDSFRNRTYSRIARSTRSIS